MSLESWKEEFYPVPAHKVAEQDAVQHSLRKWRGLTKENLAKHEVVKGAGSFIRDKSRMALEIDASSCALCKYYIEACCYGCPLYESRGDVRCDEEASCEDLSPYIEFKWYGNPLPMIEALEAAAKLEPDIK